MKKIVELINAKPWRLVIVVFVVAVLLAAPAKLLLLAVPDGARGAVAMSEPEGSVWWGRLAKMRIQVQGGAPSIDIEALRWRLAPIAAFVGTPIKISLDKPIALSAYAGIGGEGVLHLRSLAANAQLEGLLLQFAGMGLGLDAKISIEIEQLALAQNGSCSSAEGQLRVSHVTGAALSGSVFEPRDGSTAYISCERGDWLLSFDGKREERGVRENGEAEALVAKDLLGASGELRISANGNYRVNMQLKPSDPAIRDLLSSVLGSPRAGGWTLREQGRL